MRLAGPICFADPSKCTRATVMCLLVPPPDVCQADGKGWGAFASATVEAGTRVGSYEGTLLSQQEVERKYYGGAAAVTPDYLFELPSSANEKLYIDARDGTHWSRFINHRLLSNIRRWRRWSISSRRWRRRRYWWWWYGLRSI